MFIYYIIKLIITAVNICHIVTAVVGVIIFLFDVKVYMYCGTKGCHRVICGP